jgi:hypothetical protein
LKTRDYHISRRDFLTRLAAGMGMAVVAGTSQSALAEQLKSAGKRVLFVFQHGGMSQLESWDPKPNTEFGGPFTAISTSVPGVQVSELLPESSRQMHRLTLLRGLNTDDANHDSARVRMITGWSQGFVGGQYPSFGAVCGKLLGQGRTQPAYVKLTDRAHWHLASLVDAAWLGPEFAPVVAFDEQPPDYLLRPAGLDAARGSQLDLLRKQANGRFSGRARSNETSAYELSYEKARQVMQQQVMFDVSREPARDHERYGTHAFGRRCLLARRLLEHDCTFVKLNHVNYDAHFENFDNHLRLLAEFDRPFAALLEDLSLRGMLDTTLVIVMGEFGRTPRINSSIGRDHWAKAWSIAVGGCGIKPGLVHGRTNADGTEVVDGQVKAFDLFHTFYRALGLDPQARIFHGDRPLTLTDSNGTPIQEILA